MKTAILIAALGVTAYAPVERSLRPALTVYEVIARQDDLIGKRVAVRGRLSACRRTSCVLYGADPAGRERFLSIGASPAFDVSVAKLAGRPVEIEATITDDCMPEVDPDVIPLCADRSSTLTNPVLVRARGVEN